MEQILQTIEALHSRIKTLEAKAANKDDWPKNKDEKRNKPKKTWKKEMTYPQDIREIHSDEDESDSDTD